ncbi:MAG: hypothetical protein F6J93_00955 [Oscillatoria sp. SIO1A7]|nr:hypothetical protein [Oscillatoria sp. SIO1A7]
MGHSNRHDIIRVLRYLSAANIPERSAKIAFSLPPHPTATPYRHTLP